ncbi:MAG TPA: CHAT domain-containing tetratricopeptide repeat protein [Thermoanaerobaculia bacterium]|jgi:CHAT domain-containing protein/Tfp pilus assembly protein PilF|nr:CHAT domain-containing tetratricopeptide repeat protein [Thermoanaerobaculia bacterium]
MRRTLVLLLAGSFLLSCRPVQPPAPPGIPPEARARRADDLDAELTRLLEGGGLASAVERYPAAVAAREELLAGRPLELASYLDDLTGRFYFAPGATPEVRKVAETLLWRAYELRRAVPGEGELAAASTLSDLATFYYDNGQWQRAEELENQALQIRRDKLPANDPLVAKSLGELGAIYYRQGLYAKAEPLLADAVRIRRQAEPPDPLALAEALNTLAEVYRARDRYGDAEELFREALTLARPAEGDEAPLVAEILNNLAGVYRDQSRYEEVEPLLAQTLAIRERHAGDDPVSLVLAYLNQADIFRLQGRYTEAESLSVQALERGRELLSPDDPNLAWYLDQVGQAYAEAGRYDKAEPLYKEAIVVVERTLPPDHPLTAQVLNDFARMLRLAGRWHEAEQHYLRALGIRQRALGDHPETATTMTQLARCLFLENDDGRAMELAEKALGVLTKTSAYPEARVDAQALKAEILKRRGDAGSAIAALADALSGVEDLRPHTGGDERLRAEFLGRYLGYFNEMVAWQVEAGDPARALEYAERARARVLLDQLAAGRVDLLRGIPAEVLQPLERRRSELRAVLAEHQRRLTLLSSRTDLSEEERLRQTAELERQIDEASREHQRVLNEIRNASPLWSEVITAGGQPVPIPALQRELTPPGGQLLLYQVGAEQSFLFAVPPPPGEIRSWSLEVSPEAAQSLGVPAGHLTSDKLDEVLTGSRGAGASLVQILGTSRGSLEPEKPFPAAEEILTRRLHALWRVLVPADLWPQLRRASEVVLVPDGGLHRLPFEALVVSPGSGAVRYWLDDGPVVRYAPSATALYNVRRKENRSAGGERPRLLLISNPVFDLKELAAVEAPSRTRYARAGGSLERLPGTAREAEAIQGVLRGGVESLAGLAATESRVREALRGNPRYLHFATHGLVDEGRSELLAALALTPPPGEAPAAEDDGLLQLFEIYELDLDSDLAVLSACKTHAGRQLAGEGVFALSRGFLAAGARRVVASLWPVNDESTAVLMGNFYGRIAEAESSGRRPDYARALRDARRALRKEPRWSAPYHWAPFVLSGEP